MLYHFIAKSEMYFLVHSVHYSYINWHSWRHPACLSQMSPMPPLSFLVPGSIDCHECEFPAQRLTFAIAQELTLDLKGCGFGHSLGKSVRIHNNLPHVLMSASHKMEGTWTILTICYANACDKGKCQDFAPTHDCGCGSSGCVVRQLQQCHRPSTTDIQLRNTTDPQAYQTRADRTRYEWGLLTHPTFKTRISTITVFRLPYAWNLKGLYGDTMEKKKIS